MLYTPERLPFLSSLCWQMVDAHALAPFEMLQRYERGWHYRNSTESLSAEEQKFIETLAQIYGSWLANCIGEGGMFQQAQHQQILRILSHLNADLLEDCQVYFGGGTLLALKYGEYRLSKDIDFLCSSQEGYRQLREAIFKEQYRRLFKTQTGLEFPREIQANRYGVRFPVRVEQQTIRVEIVSEGRIELDEPERLDWCPVACLNPMDVAAEKLLANSDRWNDTSVLSRDLIDLAMLRSQGEIPGAAFDKAEAAYPVVEPLRRSLNWFLEKPDYQTRCYKALQVRSRPKLEQGLAKLRQDLRGMEALVF